MVVVLDASFVFPLFVREEKTSQVQNLRTSITKVIALDFLHVEVANALTSAVRQKRVSAEFAAHALTSVVQLFPSNALSAHYLKTAFSLALKINHPVYDCLYAIAALTHDATLVTCDAKFAAKLDPAVYRVQVV